MGKRLSLAIALAVFTYLALAGPAQARTVDVPSKALPGVDTANGKQGAVSLECTRPADRLIPCG